MQQVVLHVKSEFHSNRDTLTYFTAKNRSKSFICIHGLKNHIEASDLVPVFEISVGPTVRDREVVCRTDNKLNLPVLLSDNISDRVFTNL